IERGAKLVVGHVELRVRWCSWSTVQMAAILVHWYQGTKCRSRPRYPPIQASAIAGHASSGHAVRADPVGPYSRPRPARNSPVRGAHARLGDLPTAQLAHGREVDLLGARPAPRRLCRCAHYTDTLTAPCERGQRRPCSAGGGSSTYRKASRDWVMLRAPERPG